MPGVARRPLLPRHAAFVRHPWLRRAVFAAPPAALQRVRWRSTAPDEEPDFLSAVRAERNFVARREGRLRQLAHGIPSSELELDDGVAASSSSEPDDESLLDPDRLLQAPHAERRYGQQQFAHQGPFRVDVEGNDVLRRYPWLASERPSSEVDGRADRRWRGASVLERREKPPGMTSKEWRQQRQEVLEMVSMEYRIEEFIRFARGDVFDDDTGRPKRPAAGELLGASRPARHQIWWWRRLWPKIRDDLRLAADGSPTAPRIKGLLTGESTPGANLQLREKVGAGAPEDLRLLLHGFSAREIAARVLASRPLAQSKHAAAAERARERLGRLEARDDTVAGVRRAVRAAARGREEGQGGRPRALTLEGGSAAEFDAKFDARLQAAVDNELTERAQKLAVLTLQHLLVELLRPRDAFGTPRTRIFAGLGQAVNAQYVNDELLREAAAEHAAAQEAAKRERALEAEGDATSLVGAAGDEPVNSLDDLPASARADIMKRRLKRTADHSAGEALIAGRRGVVEGTPPRGPQWGNDGNIKVGAYLMMHVIGDDGLRLSSESASWAALDRGSGSGGGGDASSSLDDAAAAEAAEAAPEGAEDESLVPFAYGDTDGRAEADAADDPHVQWIDDAGPSICRMKKVAGKAPAGRGGAVKYVDSWFVEAHPDFAKTVLTGEIGTLAQRLRPEEEPMLAPPLAWSKAPGQLPSGPYYHLRADLIRIKPGKSDTKKISDRLAAADPAAIAPLFAGLNAMAATPWKINRRMYDLIDEMWVKQEMSNLPRLAEHIDDPHPPPPPPPGFYRDGDRLRPHGMTWEEYEAGIRGGADGDEEAEEALTAARHLRRDWYAHHRKVKTKNANNLSERASARLKLAVAKKYYDEERIWFPYNLDFRGRAYPLSPQLNNQGDDVARSLLLFADAKPLGADGLRWLKIHLANMYGKDKLSFDARVAWADAAIAGGDVAAAVADPYRGSGHDWWRAGDKPWQTLATAYELEAAMRLPDPTTYACALAVHQDGSCNGLQHYAALGRDQYGGEQVNLVPNEVPQDVYAGVRAHVERRVAELAAEGDELALILDGHISRKVVKQVVMTSVYGVTLAGARDQIQNRLEEIPDLAAHEERQFAMATMLAKLTLDSLGDVFKGATDSMSWLGACARAIAKESDTHVEWTTALGLPAVQPYVKDQSRTVRTVLGACKVRRTDADAAPVAIGKQKSGFSPNFVHSLDSSHLLLTAAACAAADPPISFAAVHDSYWAHPSDVGRLNAILRDKFVELHATPRLAELFDEFQRKFPEVDWSQRHLQPPPTGTLDLEEVRKSLYFFA